MQDLSGNIFQSQTDAELYTTAFERAFEGGHLTSQQALDIAKLALSIRTSAPRVEAYRQYYNQSVATQSHAICDTWVYVDGKEPVCDAAELEEILERKHIQNSAETLPFDRIRNGKTPLMILYTPDYSSLSFWHLFSSLISNDATFAIRYTTTVNEGADGRPLYLSGYGVEMALKNTDYLVIDDRKEQQEEKSSLKSKLSNIVHGSKKKDFLFSGRSTIEPLTASEIRQLGIKAAQYIAQSSHPLADLTQLAIDFPRYAKDIADLKLDEAFADEVLNNGNMPGVHAMWINGISLDSTEIDPFAWVCNNVTTKVVSINVELCSIVRVLQREQRLVDSFKSLGLTTKQAIEVITHPAYARTGSVSEDEIQDVYDVRLDSIIWWNNLEKDKRYKTWPSSLTEASSCKVLLKPPHYLISCNL